MLYLIQFGKAIRKKTILNYFLLQFFAQDWIDIKITPIEEKKGRVTEVSVTRLYSTEGKDGRSATGEFTKRVREMSPQLFVCRSTNYD